MPLDATGAYLELIRRCKEGTVLRSCADLLGWDERTYLPRAGAEHRGEQLALLGRLCHERITDPVISELLAIVEGSAVVCDPTSIEAANVREIRRDHERAVKVPKRLVEELARVTTRAQQVWQEARKRTDFSLFRSALEDVVRLKREEAQHVSSGKGHPYNALMDEYEPGVTI